MKTLTPADLYRYRGIPPWVGPPIARKGSITLLLSEPGVGKTNLALGVAYHAWRGKPFLGQSNSAARNVLFLGQDAPRWDYANTFFNVMAGAGESPAPFRPAISQAAGPEPPGPRIRFLCDPINIMSRDLERYDLEVFTQLLLTGDEISTHPDLIIIDTLSNVHTADENARADMRHVMDALRRLTDRGISVIIIHHTAINQNNRAAVYAGRGSSSIPNHSDLVVRIAGSNIGNGVKACHGVWVKGRAPDLPEAFGYYMRWTRETMAFEPYEYNTANMRKNKKLRQEWLKGQINIDERQGALDDLPPGVYAWNDLMSRSSMQAAELAAYLMAGPWVKDGPGTWRKQ